MLMPGNRCKPQLLHVNQMSPAHQDFSFKSFLGSDYIPDLSRLDLLVYKGNFPLKKKKGSLLPWITDIQASLYREVHSQDPELMGGWHCIYLNSSFSF